MSARDVLKAACSSKQTAPYAPIAFITTAVTVDMMKKAEVYWPEAHQNAEYMARLGAMGHELYGVPCLKVPFDAAVEAGALGAHVEYGTIDTFPQIKPSEKVTDAKELTIPHDLADTGRLPVVLEAIRILRKRYPELPVVAHTMGPFAIMSLLFGFGRLLEWVVLDDPNYPEAMEKCTEFSKRYSMMLAEAGADIVQFGEAAASCEVIGARTYEKHVAPYHQQLAGRLPVPVVLHMCGDITACLEKLPGVGMDGISYDFKVSTPYARQMLQGKVKTIGNIDPLGVLLNGNPETVRRAVFKAMEEGIDVLSSGCTLPPRMPEENLIAMVQAHSEYLRSKGISLA